MSFAALSSEESFARRRAAAEPRRAGPGEAAQVAGVLTRAFANDPVFDWILRPGRKRDPARAAFFDFFVKSMALPAAEIWLTRDGAASAVWLPPTRTTPHLSPLQELLLLPKLIFMTGGRRMPRVARLREALARQHPKTPDHWYLAFIGVEPALHGKGIGSALLETTLARVDEWGLPAYLEASSPHNVRLYRRHGFQIRQEFRAAPDAPPIWAMWREPHGRA